MKLMKHFVALLALTATVSAVSAQEKLKYASSVKLFPNFYLPVMAADEAGIFKKNGVSAEWFPFQSGADMHRAFASSAVKIASSQASADVLGIARGLPVVIVGELQAYDDFTIWVADKSPIKKPEELKGTKIGVSRMGGAEQAYGQLAAKKLGIDVNFVATGGIKESLALLLTGATDAVVLPVSSVIDLVLEKRVRSLVQAREFLPKPWMSWSILARRDFAEKEPDMVKRVVKSIVEANRYVMNPANKQWALAKMHEINGYSPAAGNIIYDSLDLSQTGKISPDAIKNLTSFMVENGLIKSSEVPPASRTFSEQFAP